jgi:biotin carboxyl carrier protein
MRYEIEAGGRVRHVEVRRGDDGFVVAVDGREWPVSAARIDPQTLSLLIGGRSVEVVVAPDPATGQLRVGLGPAAVEAAVNGRRRAGRRDDGHAAGGAGPQRIVAPMPGKTVRVLVKPGDDVAARQPLVVIEAMKMENELRAVRAGKVAEVHAREGASVDAGTLLVVVT